MPSMSPFSLEGQLAIVTGGGTGLGLGISQCLIEAGARVIITGRREDVLQEAAVHLGDQAVPMAYDVTDTKPRPLSSPA